jgi:hypothetical protein
VFCVVVETAGNSKIGDEGAIRIAKGLEKNTSLKECILARVFPPYSFLHLSLSHLLRASPV